MSVTQIPAGSTTAGIDHDLDCARRAFTSGRTRPLSWRVAQLEGLLRFIDDCEAGIAAAVCADLGRDPMATFMADIAPVRHEIRHTLANLAQWMKPERVRVSAATAPGQAWIVPEPKGVALILGAWNFPILLTLHPLVSCLAAGNAAVVKPSEISAATARYLSEQLPRYVDAEAVRLVLGDAEVSASLAGRPFDHTFFTGSTPVGRAVMAASARNLTPVTLELGGKSPVIVASDADVDVAARRIAWAKAVNAGQTCTAPDYVLVEESVRPALVERLLAELPLRGAQDSTRIVNDRHVARLRRILSTHGGEQYGGAIDESRRVVALGVDPSGTQRPLTCTGGLTFAGGPWNNYSTRAIATVVSRLRESPGTYGLVTANSGYLTKHAFGVYSTEPPVDGFRRENVQAEVDAEPTTTVAETHDGIAEIESWTVAFGRDGNPEKAFVAARVPGGARTLAVVTDSGDLRELAEAEMAGRRLRVEQSGTARLD
ncbi:NAD/NADP-dependent betaine aldehyde dehydrogenase [Gordonia sp. YY1]|nr:NAD/NADP-dependent betaine aldehyde dehydrogenase [Gordonia sp. YY1]MBA5845772.1 aldehyde dehydrogenase family protein [Gordonia amicalis]GAC53827.1 putative aldehyde dehydrogenase [Gordonia amicalis NBRC 100051 = JCM 11271]